MGGGKVRTSVLCMFLIRIKRNVGHVGQDNNNDNNFYENEF